MAITSNIVNNYSKRPKNLTQYTAFRGVTDFTQIGQFEQFETGYSFLSVLSLPRFMKILGDHNDQVKAICDSFVHMLEFEFRGLDGLGDVTGETFEITDGINTVNMINKVNYETAANVTMQYYERSGGLISRFTEMYLTGIKDKVSQAKTYHGLIKHGLLEPGFENEVFTMMYYVTDNTMLRLEKAFLLCNCQLTTSEQSMYNSEKGTYSNREVGLTFNCLPVYGTEVDKAAKSLLEDITGVSVDVTDSAGNVRYTVDREDDVAVLDSTDYLYGVMRKDEPEAIDALVDAIDRGNEGTYNIRSEG